MSVCNHNAPPCTDTYCAREEEADENPRHKFVKMEDSHKKGYVRPARSHAAEETETAIAVRRHEAQNKLMKVPDVTLTAEEASAYVDNKLNALLPSAIAQMEFNLRYGDDKQKTEAAKYVLEAKGFSKKETANTPQSIIVLAPGFDMRQLPWLKRDAKEEIPS